MSTSLRKIPSVENYSPRRADRLPSWVAAKSFDDVIRSCLLVLAASVLGVLPACGQAAPADDVGTTGGMTTTPTGGQSFAGNAGRSGSGGSGSSVAGSGGSITGSGGSGGTLGASGSAPVSAGASGTAGVGGGSAGGGSHAGGGGGMAGMGMAGMAGGGNTTGPTFPEKFAGNIDTRGSIRSDFAGYWDQFSPENAGKWGSVQPNEQTFNWTTLDAMYKYATEHDVVFKQHNFIWGSQQPGWTANLNASNGPAAVQKWMKAFCDRYPNTRLIDVVNEPPPHTTPKYMNAIGGAGSSGYDWIANAFKWARQACPNSILILNDYNNVESAGDIQHTIDIVNAIKKAGAPIDAVGCQTHAAANLSAATLKANIDKIASGTGLPVYITEYDLNIKDDAAQKAKLQEQFTMFWSHDKVKGVTLWGYVVGATWVTNSGLMQSDGTMRPAMTWLLDFLGRK
jgi:endo-1,4-beta-xylanase